MRLNKKHFTRIKNLAFLCTFQILYINLVDAHFELKDINLDTYHTHYNSLSSVEESSLALQASPQFQPFLEKAEEIVTRYNFNNSIGLRLIHRHFSLSQNQLMVEQFDTVNDIPSLITYPHTIEEAQAIDTVPASWIFSGNLKEEITLFETSTDSAVKAANLRLQQHPEFFDEIGQLLKDYQLNNLLSIAVLKRNSLVAEEEQTYMEVSSEKENRSIIQLSKFEDALKDSIRTSWSFKGPKELLCSYCRGFNGEQHVTVIIGGHDK